MKERRFSKVSMQYLANKVVVGLKFGNLDELRSLRFRPPPLVELVVRCVCTLISADDIGDAEALEAAARKLEAMEARRPLSARGGGGGGGGTPRQAHTMQGRVEAAREKLARLNSCKDESVRRSVARRGKQREILSWKDSVQMLARSDFKWRLMNLNGKALLDNAALVDEVRSCLDLSSLQSDHRYTILPGRSHPGDDREDFRARREFTSALYSAHSAEGVASSSPLQLEEARYTSEIAGAMLIWMRRIFTQHDQLREVWDASDAAIKEAEDRVIPTRRKVYELQDDLEMLMEENRVVRGLAPSARTTRRLTFTTSTGSNLSVRI